MIVRALQKSVRTTPRKLRLVADVVRGKDLGEINDILSTLNKDGAIAINEAIRQAVANAVNNLGLPEEGLTLKTIMINEGQSYKRFRAGSRGRAKPRQKKTSHILVEIESPLAEAPNKKVAGTVTVKSEGEIEQTEEGRAAAQLTHPDTQKVSSTQQSMEAIAKNARAIKGTTTRKNPMQRTTQKGGSK